MAFGITPQPEVIEATAEQFADEEVDSEYGYPSNYKLKGITDQLVIIRKLFPDIRGGANVDFFAQIVRGNVSLPDGAEGWFAIPHWSKVGNTYQAAVEKVLGLLNRAYRAYGQRFINRCNAGGLGPNRLRENSKKAHVMQALQQAQDEDVLIVSAQFGIRHRGRSARRARAVMNGSEFGLGIYEIGIMLLTHQERLRSRDDMWILCAGDEYATGVDDGISPVPFPVPPFFGCDEFNGALMFGAYLFAGDASIGCGSPSGFTIAPSLVSP